LIAIANGVADETRSRLIQKRVDAGQCSAASGGGGQFVSEKYYGPEDTTGKMIWIGDQLKGIFTGTKWGVF
jgi:hypothetical protein